MSEESLTQADLARKLGVSRARVTQVLRLLDLDPQVVAAIVALGGPLPRRVITERALRPFVDLPLDLQRTKVSDLLRRAKKGLSCQLVDSWPCGNRAYRTIHALAIEFTLNALGQVADVGAHHGSHERR